MQNDRHRKQQPPGLRVFLSSAYLGLQFERRLLIGSLENSRFDVLKMEDTRHLDFDPADFDLNILNQDIELNAVQRALRAEGYNPFKWSIEQARECDVLVHIFNDRIGSVGTGLGQPYTHYEIEAAYELDRPILAYHLNLPFPDDSALLEEGESIDDLDKSRNFPNLQSQGFREKMLGMAANPINRLLLTGMHIDVKQIDSAAELREKIVSDIGKIGISR